MRFQGYFFAIVALVLSACAVPEGGKRIDGSQSLSRAQEKWQVVEKDRLHAPIAMHDNAKSNVNINDIKNHAHYTKKAKKDVRKDTNFRLLVLERQMEDISHELEHYIPGHTLKQYDSYASLGMLEPPAPAHKPKIFVEEKTPVAMAQKKVIQDSPVGGAHEVASVHKMRIGQHPNKTRVVLDLNTKPDFSYDLDNSEKLLLIEVSGAVWKAPAQKAFTKHPLLVGYSAHDNGNGGTMLVLELRRDVKVFSAAMKPLKVGGYHRIVFDLMAQG